MDPAEFKSKLQKPESKIQSEVIDYLKIRDWFVRPVGPSAASCGWPDLYAAHKRYGPRWIEIKRPVGFSFTPAQIDTFPLLYAHGVGVWVVVAATDIEIQKLFQPPNWHYYLSIGVGALMRKSPRQES